MEAVDGIEKEKRADSLVKVLAVSAKGIQRGGLLEQLLRRKPRAGVFEGLVPDARISGSDDTDQLGHRRDLESRF